MKKLINFNNIMVLCTVVGFSITGGIFGTWIVDRDPPTRVLSYIIDPPQGVGPGQELRIRYFIDRTDLCATHIDRVLLDSINTRFQLSDEDYAVGPGPIGLQNYIVVVRIPTDASSGAARLVSSVSFRCNPLQYIWPIRGDIVTVGIMILPKRPADGQVK
jgi:hypothetical protein